MQINKDWLDYELHQLNDSFNLKEKIQIFIAKVNEIFHEKLSDESWKLTEFFLLVIAINIAEEFDLVSQKNPDNITLSDLYIVIKEFENFYNSKIENLITLAAYKKIVEAQPIIWLELIESVGDIFFISSKTLSVYDIKSTGSEQPESYKRPFIMPWLAELIRFKHYNIDSDLAKKERLLFGCYNIKKASVFLNITEQQLIKECLVNDFGAYVKLRLFNVVSSHSTPNISAQIEQFFDSSYIYPYEGLVRLYKTNDFFPECSLENICVDGVITSLIVPLQPSMVEFSQGIRKYIRLSSAQEISPIDLVFIKAELDQFKISKTTNSLLLSKKVKTPSFLKVSNNKKVPCVPILKKSHHLLKRELIIRYAIAFIILKNRNVISGKEIAQFVDAKFKSEGRKSISFDKMTRVINSCIRADIDAISCDHVSEAAHKLVLLIVFQLKNHAVSPADVIQMVLVKMKSFQSEKVGSLEDMQNILHQSLALNV